MRFFAKNAIMKKILIALITVVMLSNFIMPNYVRAASVGENLVSGFFYLIAYVGDVGLSIMQKMMIGTGDLQEWNEYSIKYSPGIIFSNEVPALDINFINPGADKEAVVGLSSASNKEDMLKLTDQLSAGDFTLIKEIELPTYGNISAEDSQILLDCGLGVEYNERTYSHRLVLQRSGAYRLEIDNLLNWRFYEKSKPNTGKWISISIGFCFVTYI